MLNLIIIFFFLIQNQALPNQYTLFDRHGRPQKKIQGEEGGNDMEIAIGKGDTPSPFFNVSRSA